MPITTRTQSRNEAYQFYSKEVVNSETVEEILATAEDIKLERNWLGLHRMNDLLLRCKRKQKSLTLN